MAVPELQEGIERAQGLIAFAARTLGGLTEKQLNWRPGADRWSAGENVLHVNQVNRHYLEGIEAKTREAQNRGLRSDGPFRYGWLDRWFVKQLEPPVRRRFKTPGKFGPPERTVGAAEVQELGALLERTVAALRAADGVDLTAVKVVSPVTRLIKFRLGAALRIVIAHTDRHLQQAARVVESPEFPKGEGS